MVAKAKAMALGAPANLAGALIGGAAQITPAGSTITDATAIAVSHSMATTTGSSTGVKLPPGGDQGDGYSVCNGDASNALRVYPPTAAEKIGNGAAGAAYSIAAGKGAIFRRIDSTFWGVFGA